MEEGDRPVFLGVGEDDLPAGDGLQARNGLQQFPLAAARDARNAQDLAAVGGEGHVLEHLDALAVDAAEALDLQAGLHIHRLAAVDIEGDLLAHHHFRQAALGGVAGIDGGDMLALAQDGHPVRHRQHLVQLVGDDDDGLAVRLHAAQHVEQAVDLLGRQHGGGLIQDEDIRTAVEHLDDFHRLLLGDGHIVDLLLGINMETVFLSDLGNAGIDVLQIVPALLVHAQHNVFGGGKQIHQLEVLMNHADFQVKGVLRGADDHFLPALKDLALIREVDAGDHVHQGGLAAAVLTENGQDLTLVHIQVNIVVGHNAAKPLGNAAHAESNLLFHGIPSVQE